MLAAKSPARTKRALPREKKLANQIQGGASRQSPEQALSAIDKSDARMSEAEL
jgi:hypothetical protein